MVSQGGDQSRILRVVVQFAQKQLYSDALRNDKLL